MITAYTVMASRARLTTNSKCICQLSAAFYVQKKKKTYVIETHRWGVSRERGIWIDRKVNPLNEL